MGTIRAFIACLEVHILLATAMRFALLECVVYVSGYTACRYANICSILPDNRTGAARRLLVLSLLLNCEQSSGYFCQLRVHPLNWRMLECRSSLCFFVWIFFCLNPAASVPPGAIIRYDVSRIQVGGCFGLIIHLVANCTAKLTNSLAHWWVVLLAVHGPRSYCTAALRQPVEKFEGWQMFATTKNSYKCILVLDRTFLH